MPSRERPKPPRASQSIPLARSRGRYGVSDTGTVFVGGANNFCPIFVVGIDFYPIAVLDVRDWAFLAIGFPSNGRQEFVALEVLFRSLPSALIPIGRKPILLAALEVCLRSLLSIRVP